MEKGRNLKLDVTFHQKWKTNYQLIIQVQWGSGACCGFRLGNGCPTCRLVVEIICFCVKTYFFAFLNTYDRKRWKSCFVSKKWFQPANGLQSTHLLVKIHNRSPIHKATCGIFLKFYLTLKPLKMFVSGLSKYFCGGIVI